MANWNQSGYAAGHQTRRKDTQPLRMHKRPSSTSLTKRVFTILGITAFVAIWVYILYIAK